MKNNEVDAIFQLYENFPTLVLFETFSNEDNINENEILSSLCNLSSKKLNPIDIVLESLTNVLSEEISSEEFTLTKDKALINKETRSLAVKRILKFVKDDPNRLVFVHDMWLEKLRSFLKQLHKEYENVTIDEVVFLVSNKLRISSLSALRAIKTVGC